MYCCVLLLGIPRHSFEGSLRCAGRDPLASGPSVAVEMCQFRLSALDGVGPGILIDTCECLCRRVYVCMLPGVRMY